MSENKILEDDLFNFVSVNEEKKLISLHKEFTEKIFLGGKDANGDTNKDILEREGFDTKFHFNSKDEGASIEDEEENEDQSYEDFLRGLKSGELLNIIAKPEISNLLNKVCASIGINEESLKKASESFIKDMDDEKDFAATRVLQNLAEEGKKRDPERFEGIINHISLAFREDFARKAFPKFEEDDME